MAGPSFFIALPKPPEALMLFWNDWPIFFMPAILNGPLASFKESIFVTLLVKSSCRSFSFFLSSTIFSNVSFLFVVFSRSSCSFSSISSPSFFLLSISSIIAFCSSSSTCWRSVPSAILSRRSLRRSIWIWATALILSREASSVAAASRISSLRAASCCTFSRSCVERTLRSWRIFFTSSPEARNFSSAASRADRSTSAIQ